MSVCTGVEAEINGWAEQGQAGWRHRSPWLRFPPACPSSLGAGGRMRWEEGTVTTWEGRGPRRCWAPAAERLLLRLVGSADGGQMAGYHREYSALGWPNKAPASTCPCLQPQGAARSVFESEPLRFEDESVGFSKWPCHAAAAHF